MTSANPAIDADFSVNEPAPHRRRGKGIFKLVVIATAIGFVVSKVRGRRSTPDGEADDGV